jgi:hypothetical protein
VKLPVPLRLLKERYFGESSRNVSVAKNRLADLSQYMRPEVTDIATAAVASLIDYQDPDYALLYLDRIARYAGPGKAHCEFLAELARRLDARMRYDDPAALAQRVLNSSEAGHSAVTSRTQAVAGTFCLIDLVGMLPPSAADPITPVLGYLRWSGRSITLRFNCRTKRGYRWARAWALLKHVRIYSRRFKTESASVERWLHMTDRASSKQPGAGIEVVRSADLIKGAGAVYHRGLTNWNAIVDRLIKPTCDGTLCLPDLAKTVQTAVHSVAEDSDPGRLNQLIIRIIDDGGRQLPI